jgi:cell division protease FtsH
MKNKIPTPEHSRFRILFWVSVALSFVLFYILSAAGRPDRMHIAYSSFKQKVKKDKMSEVKMTDHKITGTFKEPVETNSQKHANGYTDFETVIPSVGDPELLPLLEKKG